MSQVKIIRLINEIPKKHMPFLKEYVSIHVSEEIQSLFGIIQSEGQVVKSTQQVWKLMFANTKFNQQQFANYCHQLLNVVEQAICVINLKNKNLDYFDLLLPILLDWDVLEHYQFTFKKANKILYLNTKYSETTYYKHRLDYFEFLRLEKESSRKNDLNISEASRSLDEYYLHLKLRYLCAAHSHQKIASVHYEVSFIEDMLPLIETTVFAKNPVIEVYLHIYKMLNSSSEVHFQTLKESLKHNRDYFSIVELNEVFIYPINYCIHQINNGNILFRQELLDMYKSLPSFDVNSEEIISPWRFRNVVHLALLEKDFKWAESFIHQFEHRLLEEYRDNAIHYNLANLRFHQQKYDEVIPLLINVEYQDVNYALICKILLLKTYFEMNEIEAFFSLLESFRLFVMRNRDLNTSHRKKYLDLLSIMRKLAKLEYVTKEVIEKFKVKIEAKEIIADKSWILEQLEKY